MPMALNNHKSKVNVFIIKEKLLITKQLLNTEIQVYD